MASPSCPSLSVVVVAVLAREDLWEDGGIVVLHSAVCGAACFVETREAAESSANEEAFRGNLVQCTVVKLLMLRTICAASRASKAATN